jgi:hypothetical protein
MQSRVGWYDPRVLAAVREYYGMAVGDRDAGCSEIPVSICELVPGMVLRQDVETREGTLILSAGHQLTEMTLEKIKNFALVSGIKEPLLIDSPAPAAAPVAA